MALSDCEKCYNTPCTCGHSYRDWSVPALQRQIVTLQKVLSKAIGSRVLKFEPGYINAEGVYCATAKNGETGPGVPYDIQPFFVEPSDDLDVVVIVRGNLTMIYGRDQDAVDRVVGWLPKRDKEDE